MNEGEPAHLDPTVQAEFAQAQNEISQASRLKRTAADGNSRAVAGSRGGQAKIIDDLLDLIASRALPAKLALRFSPSR